MGTQIQLIIQEKSVTTETIQLAKNINEDLKKLSEAIFQASRSEEKDSMTIKKYYPTVAHLVSALVDVVANGKPGHKYGLAVEVD